MQKVSAYMRERGARCVSKIPSEYRGQKMMTGFFADRKGEIVGIIQSVKFKNARGHIISQTLLQLENGMSKFTQHVFNLIKLNKYKGKKNVIFPYSISSRVEYGDNAFKDSFFFIKNGVNFKKTDKDGLMIYTVGKNFKTDRLTIKQGISE